MKFRLLVVLMALTSCVNIADHYGVTLCGSKACAYKDYEGKGTAILETHQDFNYKRVLGHAIGKAVDNCLIGYAVIQGSFLSEKEVWDFQWKNKINADYIYYAYLETGSSFLIDPPFNFIHLGEGIQVNEISLVYFYVNKKRAIDCYDPTLTLKQ